MTVHPGEPGSCLRELTALSGQQAHFQTVDGDTTSLSLTDLRQRADGLRALFVRLGTTPEAINLPQRHEQALRVEAVLLDLAEREMTTPPPAPSPRRPGCRALHCD